MHLIERFTLRDPQTLVYQFTVTDPATWTQPWTAVVPMQKTDEQIYEYACHEGNLGHGRHHGWGAGVGSVEIATEGTEETAQHGAAESRSSRKDRACDRRASRGADDERARENTNHRAGIGFVFSRALPSSATGRRSRPWSHAVV